MKNITIQFLVALLIAIHPVSVQPNAPDSITFKKQSHSSITTDTIVNKTLEANKQIAHHYQQIIAKEANTLTSVKIQELIVLKDRYRKSIELIKFLYEKILGLDHHFSSLQTHQNVQQLSNPHHYPEFQETRG